MANEIAKLFVTLGLDDKEFQRNLKTIQQGMQEAGKIMTGMGVAITAAMGLSLKSFADAGDEVQKLSLKTGASAKFLSEMGYAAKMSGADMGALETAFKGIANLMDPVNSQSATTAVTLHHLGLSIGEIRDMSPEDQFNTLASAIAGLEDPTMRAAMAQNVFGRAGTELLPLLSQGAAGMEALRAKARQLGIVFDEVSANQAAAFQDVMTDLGESVKGLQFALSQGLIPALMPIIENITGIIMAMTNWANENPALASQLTTLAAAIGAVMVVAGPLLLLLPTIAASFTILMTPVGGVVAAITAMAAAIAILAADWRGIVNDFIIGAELIVNALRHIFNILPAYGNKMLGGGFNLLPDVQYQKFASGGIITQPTVGMIGEAGPEAVIPLNKMGGAGGITVNVYPQNLIGTKEDLIKQVHEGLLDIQGSNVSLGFA